MIEPKIIGDQSAGGAYLDRLARLSRRRKNFAGGDLRLLESSTGTALYLRTARARRGKAGGMRFRGEYNASQSYDEQDVVVVRGGGPSAGSYVAARSVPAGQAPNYPDVGVYWVILGRISEVSYWT